MGERLRENGTHINTKPSRIYRRDRGMYFAKKRKEKVPHLSRKQRTRKLIANGKESVSF